MLIKYCFVIDDYRKNDCLATFLLSLHLVGLLLSTLMPWGLLLFHSHFDEDFSRKIGVSSLFLIQFIVSKMEGGWSVCRSI